MPRRFVPFESLWRMPIDVPYSLLVRDGDHAWSCGQLALDSDSNVLEPYDLTAQCGIVADYVVEVLDRGGLSPEQLKRLLLYFTPNSGGVGGSGAEQVARMRSVFRDRLGDSVLLDAVPIPHFYYDGVMLEVDAFAGPVDDTRFRWESIVVSVDELAALADVGTDDLLSAHWFVPSPVLVDAAEELERLGLVHDRGAVVSAGPGAETVLGSLVRATGVTTSTTQHGDVRVTSRRSSQEGWIAARSTDPLLGLVEQTEQIMEAVAATLDAEQLGFDAIVKSTTLYAGGSSAAELHDNMAVRNRRYRTPGPASTGLPVFGFADPATRITVDVTWLAAAMPEV